MYLSLLVINSEGLPYEIDQEDRQTFLKGTIKNATIEL